MKLSHEQVRFTKALTRLLYHSELKGKAEGFRVKIGEVKRHKSDVHGHKRSVHYHSLAAHLTILTLDYDYPHPDRKRIYSELHGYWDFIGGAERIEGDANHFSFSWQGVR